MAGRSRLAASDGIAARRGDEEAIARLDLWSSFEALDAEIRAEWPMLAGTKFGPTMKMFRTGHDELVGEARRLGEGMREDLFAARGAWREHT